MNPLKDFLINVVTQNLIFFGFWLRQEEFYCVGSSLKENVGFVAGQAALGQNSKINSASTCLKV